MYESINNIITQMFLLHAGFSMGFSTDFIVKWVHYLCYSIIGGYRLGTHFDKEMRLDRLFKVDLLEKEFLGWF